MKNTITLSSYAKINLSIDVGRPDPETGMHPVDMIMQQVSLSDTVRIDLSDCGEDEEDRISLSCSKPFLPTDDRNLAWRAAALMREAFADHPEVRRSRIHIDIQKRIPVAAGLAGGSGNAAAVIHGLNTMWRLGLSLREICDLCAKLGSDIPFTACGQARRNYVLPRKVRKDPLAVSCMHATGTGTLLTPVRPLKAAVVLAKPPISVSTASVYKGIDSCEIPARPENGLLAEALARGDREAAEAQMINVLENYTLAAEPQVAALKALMEESCAGAGKVLMSGSGPTVFALFRDREDAVKAGKALRHRKYETFWCQTTI